MTMTARLTRGPGPRQWQCYRGSDTGPVLVHFSCPFCLWITTLRGGTVTADGHVAQAVTCSMPLCRMTYTLYLEGWQHDAVEHPQVFVSYQACVQVDGSSN